MFHQGPARAGGTTTKVFRLDEPDAERSRGNGAYLRFLRERNISAGVPHHFHHVTEELRVLVVCSPPED
ncbi:hypothetical protein AB0K43_06545 [Kitasatospora sp. NPDC049258]|uniref:hypothetical protein n=1 Tax=Kitasatospora sp. NPDC049258 TaxID=3155394 RepID=UPI00342FA528